MSSKHLKIFLAVVAVLFFSSDAFAKAKFYVKNCHPRSDGIWVESYDKDDKDMSWSHTYKKLKFGEYTKKMKCDTCKKCKGRAGTLGANAGGYHSLHKIRNKKWVVIYKNAKGKFDHKKDLEEEPNCDDYKY